MQKKPEHNILEMAQKRGLALREVDSNAGKVLVASGGAALWIMGHGILPIRYNQDGSKTFPDHNDQASKCYDFYFTYLTRAREQAEGILRGGEMLWKQWVHICLKRS